MEPKFQTSFIPKRALQEAATGRPRRTSVGIVTLISSLVFLISVAASVGVFLFARLTEQQIISKGADLERAQAEFEPALIEALSRLDARLTSSEALLKNHVALTPIFALLSSLTLKTVRFENFKYKNDPDKISVTLKGRARSFGSVALQSDVFGKSPFIKSPIFLNPNLDQQGDVLFDFSANLDPRLLSYTDLVQQKQ